MDLGHKFEIPIFQMHESKRSLKSNLSVKLRFLCLRYICKLLAKVVNLQRKQNNLLRLSLHGWDAAMPSYAEVLFELDHGS